jgi:uncharacterized protein
MLILLAHCWIVVPTWNIKIENGCTALFYAIDESCVNVARLLLDCGANIEHQNNKGETALFIAFIENHVDVTHLLIDCGANIDHQRNDGKTESWTLPLKNRILS